MRAATVLPESWVVFVRTTQRSFLSLRARNSVFLSVREKTSRLSQDMRQYGNPAALLRVPRGIPPLCCVAQGFGNRRAATAI
jgi:hypothetical protein